MKFKTKNYKFNGKKYTIYRLWAYKNPWFCNPGQQKKKNVEYIVIHNTGNPGNDTAFANANYFCNNQKCFAGAHFIIDRNGTIFQSGRLTDACYSIGGSRWTNYKDTGGASLYGKVSNYAQVSIELAGIVDNDPTPAQIEATKVIVSYIQKYCKNAKKIIRHFDVTGKNCPDRFAGADGTKKGKAWKKFKKEIQ